MKNNIYKYDRRQIDGYDVTDYTSYYYGGVIDLFKEYPSYFTLYSVDIDEKVENISYELYGSTDYADVILAANNDVFLWAAPYNSDIMYDKTIALTGLIIKELDFAELQGNEDFKEILNRIEEKVNLENTNRKTITVPTPKKINILLSIVKDYRANNHLILEEPEDA